MELEPSVEADLWRRIKQNRDAVAIEQVTVHYAGWAAALARVIHRRVPAYPVDCEDFIQNARLGLIEAVSRFDPDRGVPFPAFAKPRIRGAVFNGLRAIIGGRPTSAFEANQDERLASLMEDPLESPADRVINAILGLGTAALLDDANENSPVAYASQIGIQRMLRGRVSRLPERLGMVIEQHYFRHKPFIDIAAELGLTKGRVSQLHSQALRELRAGINEFG